MSLKIDGLDVVELVVTAYAHAGTGILVGSTVDALFPRFHSNAFDNKDSHKLKSMLTVAAEVAGQFGLGYLAMAELMRLFLPAGANYRSPIGDGLSTYFFLESQPHLRAKIAWLVAQARGDIASVFVHPKQE